MAAVPALALLDAAMREGVGPATDVAAIHPCSEFGQLLARTFGHGLNPLIWQLLEHPRTDPAVARALRAIWRDMVLRSFALRYSLQL
ncbi:MAG: hypothetical protein KGI90_01000 [Burkholderiales bacterium]|nr:hypothetical protein [Burkholderiales bacterium]MDE2276570.1 hypothetical protein [Burkholderiales bacterium]